MMLTWEVIEGDCRDVMRGMDDGSVDVIFTDPPYGHNNNNNGDLISRREAALGRAAPVPESDYRPIANDGKEATGLFEEFLDESVRLLEPGCCCCCCCGGGGPDPQFARWSLMMDARLQFKQMVVWDKGPMGMGWHYRRSYETVLVAQKPGAACRWYDTTNKVENVIRHVRKIIPNAEQHPTEKTPDLARFFLRLHAQAGDTVLDPFCGSGTTGVAAVGLGMNFIGIEIEPRYVEIARRRIAAAAQQTSLFDAQTANY